MGQECRWTDQSHCIKEVEQAGRQAILACCFKDVVQEGRIAAYTASRPWGRQAGQVHHINMGKPGSQAGWPDTPNKGDGPDRLSSRLSALCQEGRAGRQAGRQGTFHQDNWAGRQFCWVHNIKAKVGWQAGLVCHVNVEGSFLGELIQAC